MTSIFLKDFVIPYQDHLYSLNRRPSGVQRYIDQVQAFVAVENLFDNEYDVGRTPILTTGLPRAVRAGVQIALP